MSKKSRYEALITDFDGTLLPNSEAINQKAVVQTMNCLGFELTQEEINWIPGHPSNETIPLFLGARDLGEEWYHRKIVAENRLRYDAIWDKEIEFDSAIENTLLELYTRGIPVAIATTNRSSVVSKFLERFNIREVVNVVVSGDDVIHKKPDPEVYLTAWRLLGEKRSLAVEDMPLGVRSARAAEIHCAAIPNKYSAGLDFREATYILGSFSNLLQFF